jgi:hypothetical protein
MNAFARRLAAIAWPAFLVAGVVEIVVFAVVDPSTLHGLAGQAINLSATAVYSIAFLVFWACIAVACALTLLLDRGADDINLPAGMPR